MAMASVELPLSELGKLGRIWQDKYSAKIRGRVSVRIECWSAQDLDFDSLYSEILNQLSGIAFTKKQNISDLETVFHKKSKKDLLAITITKATKAPLQKGVD